jgi:alpha-glucosidase
LPWSGSEAPYGFGPPGSTPWLPQPPAWAALSVAAQHDDPHSTLTLYRTALRLRRACPQLGDGALRWWSAADEAVLVFERPGEDSAIVCAVNLGEGAAAAPAGELLVSSEPLVEGKLPPDAAGWWRVSQ